VAGLLAVSLGGAWRSRTDQTTTVGLEQRGIGYLHPLASLLGQLVQIQSASVRGEQVDPTKLRKTISGLNAVNTRDGEALGASQRFRALTTRIESTLAGPTKPGASWTASDRFQAWSAVVALAVELVRAVGEGSTISHDPHTDAFYLAQAVTVSLPDAMMQAGRAADLATLAGTQHITGDNAVRAGVARYSVAADGEATTSGLNRSVGSTDSRTLGSKITTALEAFRAAVANFTPPTAVSQPDTVTAAQLLSAATGIFNAALTLAHTLLFQLNELLTTRAEALAITRRNQLATGIAAGVICLLAVVVASWRRRRPGTATTTPGTGVGAGAPAATARQPALSGSAPAGFGGAG
jgi:hypothetical protein